MNGRQRRQRARRGKQLAAYAASYPELFHYYGGLYLEFAYERTRPLQAGVQQDDFLHYWIGCLKALYPREFGKGAKSPNRVAYFTTKSDKEYRIARTRWLILGGNDE